MSRSLARLFDGNISVRQNLLTGPLVTWECDVWERQEQQFFPLIVHLQGKELVLSLFPA